MLDDYVKFHVSSFQNSNLFHSETHFVILHMPLCSEVYVQKGYVVNDPVDIWY